MFRGTSRTTHSPGHGFDYTIRKTLEVLSDIIRGLTRINLESFLQRRQPWRIAHIRLMCRRLRLVLRREIGSGGSHMWCRVRGVHRSGNLCWCCIVREGVNYPVRPFVLLRHYCCTSFPVESRTQDFETGGGCIAPPGVCPAGATTAAGGVAYCLRMFPKPSIAP